MEKRDQSASGRFLIERWSTNIIKDELRFDSWKRRSWLNNTSGLTFGITEPFDMNIDTISVGMMVIQYEIGTGRRRICRREYVSGFDSRSVIACSVLDGSICGDVNGQTVVALSGSIILLDLALPFDIEINSSSLINLIIPRSLAEYYLGDITSIHGYIIDPGLSELVSEHLSACRTALPIHSIAQGPKVIASTLNLLAIAMSASGFTPTMAQQNLSVTRIAAEHAIEELLCHRRLSAKFLCSSLNISRSQLYRLFEKDGGVMNYILQRRLQQFRKAAFERNKSESLKSIAQRYGFSSYSHLSRVFKKEFGLGIRELTRDA